MSTQYPSEIDTTVSLPTVQDLITPVAAATINQLRDAIVSIETELGTKPSGIYTNLKNRITALETAVQGIVFIPSGDLAGDSVSQTVIGLRGRPISSTAPSDGDSLVWDNVAQVWKPLPAGSGGGLTPGGDLSGSSIDQVVIRINGATVPAAGSLTTDHVLKVSGNSALTYGYIVNANVSATAAISYSKLNLSNSIVNTDIQSSAAIAGTKISPDFGSQNIVTTGAVSLGTNPASSGAIRLPNTSAIKMRTPDNASDYTALTIDGSGRLWLGSAASVSGEQVGAIFLYGNVEVGIGTGAGADSMNFYSGSVNCAKNLFTFSSTLSNPVIRQISDSTNSITADSLTLQAQNATGTTSTGGDLVLTSGTGTSANGVLRLQSGGNDVISINSTTAWSIGANRTNWIPNVKTLITEEYATVSTTDATVTTAYSWSIPLGISCIEITVTAIKSDLIQGASYKRIMTFRNVAGVISAVGSITALDTKEDNAAWDCTIDNSGTTGRVRVTGAISANITWHAYIRRQEGLP